MDARLKTEFGLPLTHFEPMSVMDKIPGCRVYDIANELGITTGGRLAHLLRARGLGPLDHYAIFMENNDRYLEACAAGERAGLYYTCVNSYLTAPELAYILNNSTSKLLITSRACRAVAIEAARECPGLTSGLIVDGTGDDGLFADFETATRAFPDTPIADECLGTPMLYSSGTTGRPKGILRPLNHVPPGDELPVFSFLTQLWQYREGLAPPS